MRRLGMASIAVASLVVAGCGREAHSAREVRRAFAAEGIRLGFPRPVGLIHKVLDAPIAYLVPRNSDGELIVAVYADAAAAGRRTTYPFREIPRKPERGCELVMRFNVVSYACRGNDLSLKRVRAAMDALDHG